MTSVTLTIPFSRAHVEGLAAVSERIAAELDDLPKFPENVVELQRLLTDPTSEFSSIAGLIAEDPAFTADLLRFVNSAQFVLNRRVENVVEAVKIAGTRFLRSMLYSYGTQRIMETKYRKMEDLWNHSRKVAVFAYLLARSLPGKRKIADDCYVGGILHDVGRIIVEFLYPRILAVLNDFSREKGVPQKLLEGLSFGISHAAIGARIARTWSFPAVLVEAIEYHHEPMEADQAHRDVVGIVYLANILALYESADLRFDQIDPRVLRHLGIRGEEQFDAVRGKLEAAYALKQKERVR